MKKEQQLICWNCYWMWAEPVLKMEGDCDYPDAPGMKTGKPAGIENK